MGGFSMVTIHDLNDLHKVPFDHTFCGFGQVSKPIQDVLNGKSIIL